MPSSEILAETIGAIRDIAADEIGTVAIERAVVGLFFTGVKLSTGHVGACATPIKAIPDAVCCPSSAKAMPFPGKMRGRRVVDFLDEVRQQDGIRRAVGIATMNALAALCWERRPHPGVDMETGVDAFNAAAIRPGQRVVVVGAFVPFLRELKRRRQPYLVLEQDPATLKADEVPFYRHATQAPIVVPRADVLLVTGTTLLNDTLDEILAAARPDACKVVVGPTVGLVPDAYLRRGCDVLGTVRVTHGDDFLDILAEGGSGYHFLTRSTQKIVLRSRRLRAPPENEEVRAPRELAAGAAFASGLMWQPMSVLLPQGWAPPIGYANGIAVPAGRMVFIAGQVGWDEQQRFPSEDLVPQFEQALKNVLAVLAQAGGEPHHICRITAYCIDRPTYLGGRIELGAIWKRLMGKHYPAMSMIFVSDLLDHPAKIELEATAVIPTAQGG